MNKTMRWSGRVALGIMSVILVAATVVLGVSEMRLRAHWDVPLAELQVPSDAESIAEGRRLAQTRGCYNGCHADLEGRIFFEDPLFGRLVAPNLTHAVQHYTNAELERAIRHGIGRDNRTLVGMPSAMFYSLADDDLGRIVAFIRSEPVVESELPGNSFRLARVFMLLDPKSLLEAHMIDHEAPRLRKPVAAPTAAFGEYIARTSCAECHGPDLRGVPGFAPDLASVRAYSAEQFTTLMRTGAPADGRELDLMKDITQTRTRLFTDVEIAALHVYLQTLVAADAGAPPGQ